MVVLSHSPERILFFYFLLFCVGSKQASHKSSIMFYRYLMKSSKSLEMKKNSNDAALRAKKHTSWRLQRSIRTVIQTFDHLFHVFSLDVIRFKWIFHWNTTNINNRHFLCSLFQLVSIYLSPNIVLIAMASIGTLYSVLQMTFIVHNIYIRMHKNQRCILIVVAL